jgi:hypothetical protein
MGYVPDCDGDRGNIVFWDEGLKKVRTLEAQASFWDLQGKYMRVHIIHLSSIRFFYILYK